MGNTGVLWGYCRLGTLISCLILSESVSAEAESIDYRNSEELEILAATARRYFASNPGYRAGDLIVRSQVEEFQAYLRKTRGHSKATHNRITNLTISGHEQLPNLFFHKGHKELLRALAERFNGYAEIYRLCKASGGSKKLDAALNEGDWDTIVKMLESYKNKHSNKKLTKIYTVGDFIEAISYSEKSRSKKNKEDHAAKAAMNSSVPKNP